MRGFARTTVVLSLVGLVAVAALANDRSPANAQTAPHWPVTEVARKIMPSVVGIVVYEGLPDGPTLPKGSGTGVVIRKDGYIVTNYHVVDGSRAVKVILNGHRTERARVVGTDPLTDLAVVKVPATNLKPVTFVPERDVRVGELAVAVGNPMGPGFAKTVTMGVVSGLNRSLGAGYAQRAYDLIQTDAAINPGNSGGPLVDESGGVIGINSVKVGTPGFESMGFAIPSDTVRRVSDDIIEKGRVIRPWLGVGVVGPESAILMGLPFRDGLLVQEVYPGGPGAKAGLRDGDVILAVDGRPMRGLKDLYSLLARKRVGEDVAMRVRRGDAVLNVTVGLQNMPPPAAPWAPWGQG